MVWRYGIRSLYKLDNFVTNLLSKFVTIYNRIDDGVGFSTVGKLLEGMSADGEMLDLTRVTLQDKLASLDIDSLLVDELVTVATRVNYGQMPHILHALVGGVGLAGVDGDLWGVEGGNVRVVQCALEMSQAKVRW